MVCLSTQFLNKSQQRWIDSLRVFCKAGRGGNGLPKFGGIGGSGGDCIVEGSSNIPNLFDVFRSKFGADSTKQRIAAFSGENSRRQRILGHKGEDAIIQVPLGVSVTDEAGNLVADVNQHGFRCVVARGGYGGCKETSWFGLRGESNHIRLDLKLIADVGLVGFPNAGKSTLLKSVSRAKPKIASYPFTTIKPNLGRLIYDDYREISMADLPGLIEGAHYNLGMGHRFLRHVERTRLLVFMIDVNGFQLSEMRFPFRNAFQTIALLNKELELFDATLLDKQAICVLNKMDMLDAELKFKDVCNMMENYAESVYNNLDEEFRPKKLINFVEILPASAKYSPKSVNNVKNRIRYWMDQHEQLKILDTLNDDKTSLVKGLA